MKKNHNTKENAIVSMVVNVRQLIMPYHVKQYQIVTWINVIVWKSGKHDSCCGFAAAARAGTQWRPVEYRLHSWWGDAAEFCCSANRGSACGLWTPRSWCCVSACARNSRLRNTAHAASDSVWTGLALRYLRALTTFMFCDKARLAFVYGWPVS